MREALAERYDAVSRWHHEAHTAGWLDDADLRRLTGLERGTPADLFEGDQARPLVVALFGGTGVGKSSLLNRLAGEAIARTGLERPTSLEVTAYLHETVALGQLPEDLPLGRFRIARHRDAHRRDLMWLDMPDIDSTEAGNRALAMAWLPHIDLLVYVISPERYRDDAGWRVLLERRHRHGWLFVMNHWDQGRESQVQDLARILNDAGFVHPIVLRTCCRPPSCAERDELPRLVETIDGLRAAHGQRELERLGYSARLRDLDAVLIGAMARLGTTEQWAGFRARYLDALAQVRSEILQGMRWPIRDVAVAIAPEARSLLSRLVSFRSAPNAAAHPGGDAEQAQGPGSELQRRVAPAVWDEWAARKLEEIIDALEVEMRRQAVSPLPLVESLRGQAAGAGDTIVGRAMKRLRRAMLRPGGRLRRLLRAVTGLAAVALPAAALVWVALHVVQAFYRGVSEQGAFLGINFAVNAVLLVAVAWLLPFLVHRLLKPSLEKTAERALCEGVAEGLGALTGEMLGEFERLDGDRERLLREAEGLRTSLVPDRIERESADPAIARLLAGAATEIGDR
jgi:hypothetical protein